MPNDSTDLLDINVWLALIDANHTHHPRARRYWEEESAPRIAFCRISMLGLLRLSTHHKVMNGQPFTPTEAWSAYRAFRALPEVFFLQEPPDLEPRMAAWSDAPAFSTTRWTDGYLAALAMTSDCRLASFDRDYRSFAGLDFFHLI